MSDPDRQPLTEGPAAERIKRLENNRLGAVYSALYSFWSARQAAVAAGQRTLGVQRRLDSVYSAAHNVNFRSDLNVDATNGQEPDFTRRDSYSVILFADSAKTLLTNDVTSSPDQLLDTVLLPRNYGGIGIFTNFVAALDEAERIMEENWCTERTPIIIFLSDGETTVKVSDDVVRNLCGTATRLGKPLSFQSVLFGPDCLSSVLKRMAQIALEVQENAGQSPGIPRAVSGPPSSFTDALNTVDLTETFLGFAESMRKPRGSLLH